MKDEFKEIKPEKFKKYKKGQLGSWQRFNTDAGNVELNTAIFNNAATPQASPNTSPVGGGMGESLDTVSEASLGRVYNHMQNDFAIISASRYNLSAEKNHYRTSQLKQDIRKLGLGYTELLGRWKEINPDNGDEIISDERSLFIPDITLSDAESLGKKFEQSSIIYGKDGVVKEICTKGFTGDDKKEYRPGDVVRTFNLKGNTPLNIQDATNIFTNKVGGFGSKIIKDGRAFRLDEILEVESPKVTTFNSHERYIKLESIDDKDELNRQLNTVIKTFKSLSNEELCKEFELVDYIPDGPSFVLPSGKIVSLVNYFKYDEPTHTEAVDGMISRIADELNIDIWRVARNTIEDEYLLIDMMFDNLMNGRGWIRLNTGTIDVDERYYFVLPKRRPTNAQFSVVEDFINQGYDDRQREVLVYIEDNQYHPISKVYPYDDYMPEDIMKSIKRYYASGVLYETVNEKEHLFDEEDALALEQFIVDMIDYDIDGEFELGDGRYIIYSDKDSQYGGREFSVVDTLTHSYFASETTFGRVKPSRVSEVANRLADNLISHIEQYDNSLIGDSTLKEIKEKCLKTLDNGSDNVIILENVGGYDVLACEFDKKHNRLHIYSSENPTHDIYRGTLK